jgi:hypothetical protein
MAGVEDSRRCAADRELVVSTAIEDDILGCDIVHPRLNIGEGETPAADVVPKARLVRRVPLLQSTI